MAKKQPKPNNPPKPLRMSANTERAMKMVKRGITRYEAARRAGISLSTCYRAWARLQEQQA